MSDPKYNMLIPTPPPSPPSFTFATVDSVDPLRIALDEDRLADGTPLVLPYEPPTIVSNLDSGDRVLVLRHNGRKNKNDPESDAQSGSQQLVVLGLVGGDKDVLIDLTGAAIDVNDLTANGEYFVSTTATNVPMAGGVYLIGVWDAAGYILQRATSASLPNGVWVRSYDEAAATWSDWSSSGDLIGGNLAAKTWYRMNADGTLICRGTHTFPSNANSRQTFNWAFPVNFVGETPSFSLIAVTTSPQNVSLGVSAVTLTGVTIEFYRTTTPTTTTQWTAEGRWK